MLSQPSAPFRMRQVVGLEVLGVELGVGAPQPVAPAHAVDVQLQGRAAERPQRRIERRIGAVGTLREVRARPLHPLDCRLRAVHHRHAAGGPELVLAAAEAQQGVAGQRRRVLGVEVGQRAARVDAAMHGAGEDTGGRAERAELLQHAADAVVSPRRNGDFLRPGRLREGHLRLLLGGRRRQEGDRGPRWQPAAQLGGGEDRGGGRIVDVVAGGDADRTGADAARVVEVRVADVEERRALEEERPPLGEAGLERGQVHFGRVGFHLAEVGVDGRFEREVGPEAHLDVGAEAADQVRPVGERVAGRRLGIAGGGAGDVGRDLEAA